MILPSDPQPGMGVRFFFHGVADPASDDNPGGSTAEGDMDAAVETANDPFEAFAAWCDAADGPARGDEPVAGRTP